MIDYVNEQLFRTDSIPKSWSITGEDISLSNVDIYSESVELMESLCSDENIVFGSCIASTFKFTTSAINTSFKGKEITVSIVLNDDSEHPFELGTFFVEEDKLSADRTKKDIVAYDAIYRMINTNVAGWYNNLTFPLTLANFRDSFFANLEIPCETTILANDDMVIEKTIDTQELSGGDVIKAICEINGVLGHINREGVFVFKSLGTTSDYSITPIMYSSCQYEDYTVEAITKIQIREEEGDIGVIVGTGDNDYIVEDNFLVYGKGTSDLTPIATNLLNAINNIIFTPCTIECIGNPCVEVGDRITLTKTNEDTVVSYVLNRTLKGIQALFDEYTAEGDETYPDNVNGVHYDIRQLKGKSNVLQRSIEETRSTITNVAEGLQTEITQTAEGLQIQIEDLQSQIDGETAYYEREGEPTLLNYPYWDFTTSIPCNNTIQTAPIYDENMTVGGVGEEYPHFTYTEQNRKDHRSDLVYDTDNNLGYRFVCENGVWYWKEIADSEYTQILSRLSSLEATAEQLQVEYSELSATVDSQGLTITQHTSQLTQTASQISSLVSTTTTLGNRVTTAESRITQTSNSISSEVTRATNAENSLSSRITQTADSISSEVSRATSAESSLSSRITQNANAITAKVSSTGGSASSFAYELTSSRFKLISSNTTVFEVDATGATTTNLKIRGGNINIQASDLTDGTIRTYLGSTYTFIAPRYLKAYYDSSNYVYVDGLMGVSVTDSLGTSSLDGGHLKTESVYCDDLFAKTSGGSLYIYHSTVRVSHDLRVGGSTVFSGNVKIGENTADYVGFYGTTPQSRQTVSGSTDSAKLTSLINALKKYGLITTS